MASKKITGSKVRKSASKQETRAAAPRGRKGHDKFVLPDPQDRSWVDAIVDPVQRALARALPEICGVFGTNPADMCARAPSRNDLPRVVQNTNQKFAVGMAAYIGRELGLGWNQMHARAQGRGASGATEILDLAPMHRHSLAVFYRQFAYFVGLPMEAGAPYTTPVGEIGRYAHDRYVQIFRTVAAEANRGRKAA